MKDSSLARARGMLTPVSVPVPGSSPESGATIEGFFLWGRLEQREEGSQPWDWDASERSWERGKTTPTRPWRNSLGKGLSCGTHLSRAACCIPTLSPLYHAGRRAARPDHLTVCGGLPTVIST